MKRAWSWLCVVFLTITIGSACSEDNTEHSLTTTPEEFVGLQFDATLQTLNIQGPGNISDFSLSKKFPNLETLSVLFTPDLTTLPEDLNQLPNLQKVELTGTTFTEIPHHIHDLSVPQMVISHNPLLISIPDLTGAIEDLSIQSNPQLTTLPKSFGHPEHLEQVDLSNNALASIPDTIEQYENIVTLNVRGNDFQTLPKSIQGLRRLRQLDISDNPITTLPKTFGRFADLEDLRLHNLDTLIELPDLSGLQRLRTISLVGCTQLVALPDSLITLNSLESLEIYATGIQTIPEGTLHLPKLERAKIRMNPQLTYLPDNLGVGPKLQFLMLDQNGLVEVPSSIGNLNSLSALFLDENQLRTIPSQLCKMTTLEELSLAQNQVANLCQNIDELTNLRKLNLFGNPITALPPSMQRLSKLEFLNLWDVPFAEEPTLLYDMSSLKIVGVNTPDDHPSPDIIRLMRQELSGQVQFMDPDI